MVRGSCQNCTFWEQTGEGANEMEGQKFGNCQRYPPSIGRRDDDRFPEVWMGDWCGEFKRHIP